MSPNIHIKMSGFAYVSQVSWDYPHSDTHWIVRALYEHFGPGRLCWGSDYPVVRNFMTYQHALEAFRTHCTFIPENDKAENFRGNPPTSVSGRWKITNVSLNKKLKTITLPLGYLVLIATFLILYPFDSVHAFGDQARSFTYEEHKDTLVQFGQEKLPWEA